MRNALVGFLPKDALAFCSQNRKELKIERSLIRKTDAFSCLTIITLKQRLVQLVVCFEYFIEFSEEKDGGMDTTPLKDKLGSSVINK